MALFNKLFGDKGKDKGKDKDKRSARKGTSIRRNSVRRKPQSTAIIRPRSGSKPGAGGDAPEQAKQILKKRVSMQGKQLGSLLIKNNAITETQLEKALSQQEEEGGLLGQILVSLGICGKSAIGAALKKQRTITTVTLDQANFDLGVLELLPRSFCLKYRLIPFEKLGNHLCVAMSNVLDTQAKTDIKEQTQFLVKPFDASWKDIQVAIDLHLPAAEESEVATTGETGGADDLVIELPDDEIDFSMPEPDAPLLELSPDDTVPDGLSPVMAASSLPPVGEAAGVIPASEVVSVAPPVADFDVVEEITDVDDSIEVIDEIDDLAILAGSLSTPSTTSVEAKLLPPGVLAAIPIPEAYFSSVVSSGKINSERRWLVEHTSEIPLPMEPAPDLKVS